MSTTGLAKRLEVLSAEVDAQIVKLRANGGSPLDAAMLDKLLRPYAQLIEVHRAVYTNPDEFQEASAWGFATLMCELLLNTRDKNDPAEMAAAANDIMQSMATNLSNMLNASVPGFNAQTLN